MIFRKGRCYGCREVIWFWERVIHLNVPAWALFPVPFHERCGNTMRNAREIGAKIGIPDRLPTTKIDPEKFFRP